MIENGGPHGMKKASKLKPLAFKVWFLEILMDFGKLCFAVLGCWQKAGLKIKQIKCLGDRTGPNRNNLEIQLAR